MPRSDPKVDGLLAPVYSAFPLARAAIDLVRAEIVRLYPPVPDITEVFIAYPGSGRRVEALRAGASIAAASLPAGATIAVTTSAPCTVAFEFDGRLLRQESNPPYSIGGDASGGRLDPWDGLTPGTHRLKLTPFDRPGGRAGSAMDLTFAIVDDAAKPPVVLPPATLPPASHPPPGGAAGNAGFLPPLADGARQFYVRADGEDGNAGDAPNRPLRTIARAISLLRPAAGDRILLHAGDRFDTPIGRWRFSGLEGRPAGVFAYDDPAAPAAGRPVVAVHNANGIDIDAPGVHDVAFVGLHLTAADRDPAGPYFDAGSRSMYGIQALYPTRSLRIEDCRIDHFMYNLSFVAAGNKGQHTSLLVRRCLLLDAWGPPSELFRGQGLYLESCRGVTIVQCVLDHNGWIEGVPGIPANQNIYRHGAYINDLNVADVVFEENLASRNSNYGAQLRCGGVVRHNLFFDNATCVGVGGETADVSQNLFVDGHDTDQYGQGIAIEVFSRQATLTDNVILDHDGRRHAYPAARIHISRRPWTPIGERTVRLTGNALWGSDGPALRADDSLRELIVRDNHFQQCRQQVATIDRPCGSLILAGNAYAGLTATTFGHHAKKGQALSLEAWSALTGDTSLARLPAIADRDWRFDAAFVRNARQRPRGTWDADHDCRAMVAEARRAFGPVASGSRG